jgi:thiol-disulfide isomerase/thioredoxin
MGCLITATNTFAQQPAIPPSKTTEKQADASIDYKQMGAPMPAFLLIPFLNNVKRVTSGKETFTNTDLDNGANLFVMMFNPTCSHCQDETVTIEKNIALFKKSKVVLLANMIMKSYLDDFVKAVNLDEYPSIYLGLDSMGFINNTYLYQALPQINIYNGDRMLIKTYTGEVAIDSLKKYIQ